MTYIWEQQPKPPEKLATAGAQKVARARGEVKPEKKAGGFKGVSQDDPAYLGAVSAVFDGPPETDADETLSQ